MIPEKAVLFQMLLLDCYYYMLSHDCTCFIISFILDEDINIHQNLDKVSTSNRKKKKKKDFKNTICTHGSNSVLITYIYRFLWSLRNFITTAENKETCWYNLSTTYSIELLAISSISQKLLPQREMLQIT